MIPVLIVIGIVLALGLGFYLTRGAEGPPPLGAKGRLLDQGSQMLSRRRDALDAGNKADSED